MLVVAAPAQPAEKPRSVNNIVYKTVGKRQLMLNLHYPSEGKAPYPTAMVIPGGGWRRGTRRSRNAMMLARLLNRDGVVCATIDIRHAPKDTHPAQIEDCRRAMQWLRAHASKHQLDPKRMMACGMSAGGHLAALLGAEGDAADPESKDPIARMSTRPIMVLSLFGPMDLADEGAATNAMGRALVRGFLGIAEIDAAALKHARSASPVHRIAPGAPPFLFIHGDRDGLVPEEQSKLMVRALDKLEVPNKLFVVSGGHGDFVFRLSAAKKGEEPEYWRKSRAFMKRHWRDRGRADKEKAASGQ